MALSRKERKLFQDKVMGIMGRVENAVKEEVGVAGEATSSSLDDLRRQYETVNVKVKKKGTDGQMALFLSLEGQSPSYLQDTGLDTLCMEQGGGGQYEVWIQAPGQMYKKYWGGAVMGQSYDIPKAKREALNPFAALTGAAPFQLPSGNYHLPEVVGQGSALLAKQSEQSADRMTSMMMMMQQQQQQSAAMQMQIMQQNATQQMQMLAALFSGKEHSGPSEETRRLEMEMQKLREDRERERREEERRRDEDRRREDERRWQQMQQQVADQKNNQLVELAKLGNRGDKDMAGILATVFGSNQQLMQSANAQYITLLEKMMDKPSETEKIGELTNVMLNSQLGQMNLMTQALQSGLLGGSEPQHPVLEAVKEGIRALAQMRGMGIPGPQQPQDGGYYEEDPRFQQGQARTMPQPQEPSPQQLQPSGPMGSLPAPQSQEQEEQIEIPPEALLNKADMERLEKDRALVPVIATILRGDDLTDVPLRLFIHATQGGSPLAQRWLEFPSEVTWQVCQHYDVPRQRAEEVLEALAAFIEFVTPKEHGGQGRSPEEWGSGSYTPPPLRKPEPRPVQTAAMNANPLAGSGPELGVTKAAPPAGVQYEEYDPGKPPPGHSLEDAEKESREAARRALAAVQPQVSS
jgi:hypothetical protein